VLSMPTRIRSDAGGRAGWGYVCWWEEFGFTQGSGNGRDGKGFIPVTGHSQEAGAPLFPVLH